MSSADATHIPLMGTEPAHEPARPVRFLLLPWELRNIIYRQVFRNTTLDIFEDTDNGEEHYIFRNSSRSLLGVCRQIKAEAAPHLYLNLTIRVEWALLPTERPVGNPQVGQQAFLPYQFYFPEILQAFSCAHTIAVFGIFATPEDLLDIFPVCTSLRQLDLAIESSSAANLFTQNGAPLRDGLHSVLDRKWTALKEVQKVAKTLRGQILGVEFSDVEVSATGTSVDFGKCFDGGDMARIDWMSVWFSLKMRSSRIRSGDEAYLF